MFHATFLGHAGFKIELLNGRLVYLDPWLEANPVCPPELKQIDRADVILISHGHFDHLDPAIPAITKRTGAAVFGPPAVRLYLESKGTPGVEKINTGGTVEVHGLKVTMTEGRHGAHISNAGGQDYPHESCGYILRFPGLPTIYYSGDTAVFPGMELIARMYSPEIAFLPIGGRYTMGPYEAAWATRLLGIRTVVPMHYGTMPNLPGTLSQFQEELADDIVAILPFQPGETIAIE